MNDMQATIAAIFGVLLAAAGLVMMFRPHRGGRNRVKALGFEFDFSTPALVLVLLGIAVFLSPFLVRAPTQAVQPTALPAPQSDRPAPAPEPTPAEPRPAPASPAAARGGRWIYIGAWRGGAWSPGEAREATTIQSDEFPQVGAVYSLRVDVNLRTGWSNGPEDELRPSVGVIRFNQRVRVQQVTHRPASGWVWAKVRLVE